MRQQRTPVLHEEGDILRASLGAGCVVDQCNAPAPKLSGPRRSIGRELRGEGASIRGAALAASDVGGQTEVLV